MKTKRFLTFLLCIALSALFVLFSAACGESKDDNEGGNTGGGTVERPDPDEGEEPEKPTDPDEGEEPEKPGEIPIKNPSDYTLADFGLLQQLATIDIVTDSGEDITGTELDQPYYDCTISVSGAAEEMNFSDVEGEVRIRGNNTANYEKKSYRIKFAKKRNLLGMNGGAECKNWVLLACYKDVSMLRDAVVFQAAKDLLVKDGYYASDFCFAQVKVNGDYRGVYFAAEQQQVNKNRVDVTEPEEGYSDTDIGYLVEYDGLANREDTGTWFEVDYTSMPLECENGVSKIPGQWPSGFSFPVRYTIKNDMYGENPEETDQFIFISNYIENVFKIAYDALYNDTYNTFNEDYTAVVPSEYTDARTTIEAVIDLDSWVDMYLLQEIACDNDIDWSSFFMSVDMSAEGNKKLTFEAPWDFDSGLGMMKGLEDFDKIFASNPYTVAQRGLNPWTALPAKADWFWQLAEERWNEFVEDGGPNKALGLICAVTEGYKTYFAENYDRWDNLGKIVDEYQSEIVTTFKTHADSSAYLYEWLEKRFAFLGGYFAAIQ